MGLKETYFLFNMYLHFPRVRKLLQQINFIHIYKNLKFQSLNKMMHLTYGELQSSVVKKPSNAFHTLQVMQIEVTP